MSGRRLSTRTLRRTKPKLTKKKPTPKRASSAHRQTKSRTALVTGRRKKPVTQRVFAAKRKGHAPKGTVFTVDRAKWTTGTLLRSTGGKWPSRDAGASCCLGHVCLQLGFTTNELRGRQMPSQIPGAWGSLLVDSSGLNKDLAYRAAEINDDMFESLLRKERRLRALFRRHGYGIRFVGEHPVRRLADFPST